MEYYFANQSLYGDYVDNWVRELYRFNTWTAELQRLVFATARELEKVKGDHMEIGNLSEDFFKSDEYLAVRLCAIELFKGVFNKCNEIIQMGAVAKKAKAQAVRMHKARLQKAVFAAIEAGVDDDTLDEIINECKVKHTQGV
jgi:hypothetical protein